MSARNAIAKIWTNIQYNLFPYLEQQLGELSSDFRKLAAILELIRIEDFIPSYKFNEGRPPRDLAAMARAYIAKIYLKINYTRDLVERLKRDKQLQQLCGFDLFRNIPSQSKFSRAFKKFATLSIPEKSHQALIQEVYKDELLRNIVIDSAPLSAREKAKRPKLSKIERKRQKDRERGAKKRGELLNRRQIQMNQDNKKSLQDLPKSCDKGMKKSSEGYTQIWKGYKLHVAINDDCVPIASVMTSASLNDCEAAIPLIRKSNQIASNLYNLMDAAYDHPEIKQVISSSGRVAIIDSCPKGTLQKEMKTQEIERKKILNFETVEDRHYKERMPKERFIALYKDFYGGRSIFYKGYEKVFCHVQFGVLTLTASTLLNLIT
jgi:hypothetical protein